MKLPVSEASTTFANAEGSAVPKEFALAARSNPEQIPQMAESAAETKMLEKEALVRQFVLLIDRSGSMGWPDGDDKTRWERAKEVTKALVPSLFKYDVDKSIPLFLFDSEVSFVGECTNASQIETVFTEYQPGTTTNLSGALEQAMEMYLGSKRVNYEVVPGTTFIVLLDGGADNPDEVVQVLQKYADPANGYISNHTQAAVSFVQIADDISATMFLRSLDELKPLDIVDTKKDDFIFSTDGGVDKLLHDAVFD
ncbi:putative von Willebrand factor [Feldmannia species virus]|uniref:Putative von Willebrand factor n=1 Tax=Feldmannia species virus TaxID=39420 RepID=B5LWN6_9PHYC|nr:putative von Willebrand factor [Feldmannia species virus]ACH46899.1 putative von Willebrand factor [Feldmannia species virus]